jgi:hypothetical protein
MRNEVEIDRLICKKRRAAHMEDFFAFTSTLLKIQHGT